MTENGTSRVLNYGQVRVLLSDDAIVHLLDSRTGERTGVPIRFRRHPRPELFDGLLSERAVATAIVAASSRVTCYLAQTKSPLGRGGFGEVYLSASRTHVLKFVPVAPGSPPSFERQIAAESPVLRDHPHIVNLEDLTQQLGVTDCEVFRMPVLTNQLKVGRALPADAVHAQLLGALKALWADGWAYVDIKPDNLRMPDPSKVVLIDLDCVRRPRSGGCRAAVAATRGLDATARPAPAATSTSWGLRTIAAPAHRVITAAAGVRGAARR